MFTPFWHYVECNRIDLITANVLRLLTVLAVVIEANRYPHGVRLILRREARCVVDIGC